MSQTSQPTTGIPAYSTALGVGKEATFGTAVAATVWIPFDSHDLMPSNKLVSNMAVRKSAGMASPNPGNLDIKGTLKLAAVDVDTVGILMSAAMGIEAVTTATGISTHTYNMGGPLNSYTFVTDDNNGSVTSYFGCKIDSLDISAKAGDFLNLSYAIIGQSFSVVSGTASGVTYSKKDPLHFNDLAIGISTLGGDSINVSDLSISMKNNLNQHYGSLGGRILTSLDERQREVTGSFTLNYDEESGDEVLIALWGNTDGPTTDSITRQPLVFTFTQSASASLGFDCGYVTLSDVTMTRSKNATLTLAAKFTASETQASGGQGNADDLSIVLKNTTSTNYTTS